MKESVVVQCSWLGDRQHSLKNPEEIRKEEAGGIEGKLEEVVVREPRENKQNGCRGI